MKRGFTLIELLAVIVILAIIALIATPIVLSIIDETKDNASLRSAEFYLDAVEQSILRATLNNRTITDGVYNILNTGNICIEEVEDKCEYELVIEVKGEKPNKGTISIKDGKIEDISLNLNDKVIVKGEENKLEFKEESSKEDTDKEEPICKLVSGESKEIGSKYECEVKPGTKYNFYVISKEADKINLIMERNICKDGDVATEENLCLVAWISDSTYGCGADDDSTYCAQHDKGPVTVMTHLHNATNDWTNIPNIVMDYEDENILYTEQVKGTNGYGSIKTINNITTITDKEGNVTATYENLKSRLPKYNEVHGAGKCLTYEENGDKYGSCPLWLVDYLYSSSYYTEAQGKTNITDIYGYWTLSSGADYSNLAWDVDYGGCVYDNYVSTDSTFGVRPVITVLKSDVS